ncbi:hypothetical protein [Streptomyces acidiscabies]|uniref:Uncharacterized protein n=1 Tax=Streptomyces acidiscabies TaxID=42234 RepID=A0AAP6BCV2_9ACTN|nr:hypothetical protein [Streptomyces acidiscabies]MBZ3909420.1 hypothetical protein [Streptomyces acidiscabies]MDX2962413.1 hypothetical protein [Streptomyces acidiscabies]MDX3792432.1 hypothetical protein [Streptomyces acidiscabies]
MAYCSLADAREKGVTGDDADVAAWIAAAMERITRYTQDLFEPTPLVVVSDVGAGGLIILPRRVRTVSSVRPVLASDDAPSVPSSAYRVTSSDVLGQVDAVHLRLGGWDDLVVGAESYNGGWARLWDRWGARQVEVAGVFGYAEVPLLVAQACALLAADLQAQAAPSDADAATDPSLQVDDEGNNVAIENTDASSSEDVSPSSSTGSTQVDALLASYLNRGHTLIGGV